MVFTAGQKLESHIDRLVRKFCTAANPICSRSKYASEMSKAISNGDVLSSFN